MKTRDWYHRILYKGLVFATSLVSIEALATVIYLICMPADPKNNVFLGFSIRRLIIVVSIAIIFIIALLVTLRLIKFYYQRVWSAHIPGWLIRWYGPDGGVVNSGLWEKIFLLLLLVLFLSGWVLSWSPEYLFGESLYLFRGIRPVIIFLTVIAGEALILFSISVRVRKSGILKSPALETTDGSADSNNLGIGIGQKLISQVTLRAAGILLILFLVSWLIIGVSGLGVIPDVVFWKETGVPFLSIQILLSGLIGIFVMVLGPKISLGKLINRQNISRFSFAAELVICLLIWVAAAGLWSTAPQVSSFFAPDRRDPNNEYYPFSDAADYDMSAQFALIGQKLNNGAHVDKPLYIVFLVLLHSLVGQNLDNVNALQAAFLAVFPVILYLLGKMLHSRAAGLVVALLGIFKGLNAIASARMIVSSNPKLLMTEYPLMLGMGILILWLVIWSGRETSHLQQPDTANASWKTQGRRLSFSIFLVGGTLGLLTLVRNNAWAIFPAVLFFIWLVTYRKWKRSILYSLLLLSAMLLSVAPWMWRTYETIGTPIYFQPAFGGVVWKNRYVEIIITPEESALISTPKATLPSVKPPGLLSTQVFTIEPSVEVVTPDISATPLPTRTLKPSGTPVPSVTSPVLVERFEQALIFIPAHFFHNLLTSVLTLPTTFVNDDLQHTIQVPGSYWDTDWRGNLSPGAFVLLFVNLIIIALGVGAAWEKVKFAALAPLIIYLTYYFGNALARTSGGRYLVPVDWVVYLYFSLGLIQALRWLLTWLGFIPPLINHPASFAPSITWNKGRFLQWIDRIVREFKNNLSDNFKRFCLFSSLCGLLLFLGFTPLLSESVFQKRYPEQNKMELYQFLDQRGVIDQLGFERDQLDVFIANKHSVLSIGRGLFPRAYFGGGGEPTLKTNYRIMGFPRLAFTLVGPKGIFRGILPSSNLKAFRRFPDAADIVVIGCDKGDANVLALIILGQKDVVTVRSPASPLTCPLKVPVCMDDKNCK